jgi:hypothetical protein
MELLANSVGVAIAEIVTLPICTVKTNYQTNNHKDIKYIINEIYRKNGLKGFFEAKFTAIASQTISTASKYYFYNQIKNYRGTDSKDIINNSINGMFGGICGSIFSHPIDVIKLEQQRQISFSNIIDNIRKNNIRYLYRGYSQSIIKNILLYSSMYPVYDFYKKYINSTLISAPLTTITITLFLQPIDYIKINVMTSNKVIYRNLYRGLTLNLGRSIPHFLITMSIMEFILEWNEKKVFQTKTLDK